MMRGWRRAGRVVTRLWWPLLALLPTFAAQAAPVRFQLDNGLRVIVQEDRRAPVVITQVWYRVGSADEAPGRTGLSHLLEHMMFKGTPQVPAGEFSRLVSHVGGDDNAFTTDQYTVYYQEHLADRLDLALALEADRMRNLRFDPAEFASELQVVMEERRQRTDDSPQGLALERFQAMAHVVNPERNPTIGWMTDLQGLTVDDARAWYDRWYAPNNATLVVVGAVSPDQVEALARKHFAALPAQILPRRAAIRELPEPGERELRLQLQGQVPSLYLAWNWPGLASAATPEEAYGLRLLAGLLDEGLSARLERRLVRAGKAVAVRSGYDMLTRGDTLFTITVVPAGELSLEDLRAAVLTETDALARETVSAEEISRVIANIVAGNVYDRDDISAQAGLLGQLDANDLPLDWAETLPARLAAITPAQLQALAQRYLSRARMSSLLLTMKPGAQP